MRRPFLMLLATATCLLTAGCAVQKKTAPEDPKPAAPSLTLIGRIASIPPDRRFVLIQSYGSWKPTADTILTAHGPDARSANLKVTGETLGQFTAADIQSGEVEIGDAVYLLPTRAPTAPDPTEDSVLPAPSSEPPSPEDAGTPPAPDPTLKIN
jgi:hypothetical protein